MDSCNQTCEEYFLTVRKLLISGNFNELFTASFTASGIKPHKQNNIFRMTENCWMLNLKQKKIQSESLFHSLTLEMFE